MTTYLDKINAFLKKLDHTTLSELESCATVKTFKKGEFLLKQDQICRYSFQIEKGVARKYYLNDGREITTELFFETDLAISFESYALQKTSREIIQAITDVQVSMIEYTVFENAKKKNPKLAEFDLMLTEYYAIWLEDRLFQFHTLDATERYKLLLKNHAQVIQNIPLTFIASYLGISLETLSRIRAKI
jgi:CRP-like cAMP-binding protein